MSPPSPEKPSSQSRYENLRSELSDSEAVSLDQLPVRFFLGSKGALPPPNANIGIDIEGAAQRMNENFFYHSSPCNGTKVEVLHDIEDMCSAIHAACGTEAKPTLSFIRNPHRVPASITRDNDTKPNYYGVLNGSSDVAETAKDDYRKRDWAQIGVLGGFKQSLEDEHENWDHILWSLRYIMQADPRRRFVFAFTIEDIAMRIWLASRSGVLVSLPFNFIERCDYTVEFFLRLMYANEEQLGWDPTIERLERDSKSEPSQYRIQCADTKYRAVRAISDLGVEELCGHGTRVWEVRKINDDGTEDKTSLVLKDSWVDPGRRREHVVLQNVRKAAERQGLLEGFKRHFMQIRVASDVYVGQDIDNTHIPILRGRCLDQRTKETLDAGIQSHENSKLDPACARAVANQQSASHTVSEPPDGERLPRDPILNVLTQYNAKVHYRVVYEELACTIAEMETLSGSLEALIGAVQGLKILHQCGWVHRDISTGNVLVVDGVGKLSDLEYAEQENDMGTQSHRAGTEGFMATEVQVQRYRHVANRMPRQNTVLSASQVRALRKQAQALCKDGRSPILTKGKSTPPGTPSASGLSTLPGAALNPGEISPYDADEFRHNPLHDLESVLWLAIWLLVCSGIQRSAQNSDKEWTRHLENQGHTATKLFRDFSHRQDVISLRGAFASSFNGLLHQVVAIAGDLNKFRYDLHQQYLTAENERYLATSQPPFATMSGTLHDGLVHILSEGVAYLRELGLDLDIDESSWNVERARAQLSQSETAHSATSASGPGKRKHDADQKESEQCDSKRQKTRRVVVVSGSTQLMARTRTQQSKST